MLHLAAVGWETRPDHARYQPGCQGWSRRFYLRHHYKNCRAPGKANCRSSKNESPVHQDRNKVGNAELRKWKWGKKKFKGDEDATV